VPPLALPDAAHLADPAALVGVPAVALFLERAQAVTTFRPVQDDIVLVAAICGWLDGLPLAIELAAARVRVLSLPDLLGRLDRRLPLLTGGAQDLPARQQTLRAAVDWSYNLLPPKERRLYRRLGVFAGGFSLAAATAVADGGDAHQLDAEFRSADREIAVLEGLTTLVDSSLVHPTASPGHSPRFRMLETIREYALLQLAASGEEQDARAYHAAWCLDLVEAAEPWLAKPQHPEWLDELEMEHDNMRAALAWCCAGGRDTAELAWRFGAALEPFWQMQGHFTEGRRWLDRMLHVPALAPSRHRARTLTAAGVLAWRQGDYENALRRFHEGLAVLEEVADEEGATGVRARLAVVAYERGDYDQAQLLNEHILAWYQRRGDQAGNARTLHNLGNIAYDRGDLRLARTRFEESLNLKRQGEDTDGIANSLNNLGNVMRALGDLTQARALLSEGLALRRTRGNPAAVASSLLNLGTVACDFGEYVHAAQAFHESLQLCHRLGLQPLIVANLRAMARLMTLHGRGEVGGRLLGAAEAWRERIGGTIAPAEQGDIAATVSATATAMGEAAVAVIVAAGRQLPHEQAVTEALAGAADIARAMDETPARAP
jgi:predicted ATPase